MTSQKTRELANNLSAIMPWILLFAVTFLVPWVWGKRLHYELNERLPSVEEHRELKKAIIRLEHDLDKMQKITLANE